MLHLTPFVERGPRSLKEYREMTNLVLCRVLLFNAKRGGEIGRATITNYNNRIKDATNREDHNLTPLDVQLCKRQA